MAEQAKTHPLHWHECWSCGDLITCACAEPRSVDRQTGKERKLLCLDCQQFQNALASFYSREYGRALKD